MPNHVLRTTGLSLEDLTFQGRLQSQPFPSWTVLLRRAISPRAPPNAVRHGPLGLQRLQPQDHQVAAIPKHTQQLRSLTAVAWLALSTSKSLTTSGIGPNWGSNVSNLTN